MVRLMPSLPVLLATAAVSPVPAEVAQALPDLAVRRDGFQWAGDTLRVVVENLGDTASPATELELSDRPFSGGPTGTSSHYRPVPGMQAVWVDHEPAGADVIRLRVALGRGLDPAVTTGELRFRDARAVRLESAPPGVTLADGEIPRVEWGFPLPPEGAEIVLAVDAEVGTPPRARLALTSPGKLPPPVYTAQGRRRNSVVELTLDCLDRPAARRERVAVPALAPGERATLAAPFAGGARGEVSARIDPDAAVPEIREGNNLATRSDDSSRWSLSALHVHSCFSEGPGSFDWQAWHAARSGYDLVWWSEHDWRVACRDHLNRFGFEPDEPVDVKFDTVGRNARAEIGALEVAGGSNAVVLSTERFGGTCRARV
ncbi:MAG TPA: hypothetical protein VKU85_14025, partial [bacterium]|nr:hypothetical protein [bacterium]